MEKEKWKNEENITYSVSLLNAVLLINSGGIWRIFPISIFTKYIWLEYLWEWVGNVESIITTFLL